MGLHTQILLLKKNQDVKPPERKNKQRPGPQYTKPIETPKRKLTFQEEDEDTEEIQKEIEEVQRAEEALTLEREKIERERIEILKKQQKATKGRLVAMRQQRKRLEESIAQMGKEMAQDSQISYKDRLTRRQNLENEYGNQIERESEMVQDFIDLLDNKKPRGFMQSCFPVSVYFKCLREFLLYFYKCSTFYGFYIALAPHLNIV